MKKYEKFNLDEIIKNTVIELKEMFPKFDVRNHMDFDDRVIYVVEKDSARILVLTQMNDELPKLPTEKEAEELNKAISLDPKTKFKKLLGDKLEIIINENWVKFRRQPYDIYKTNEIGITFLEKDNKGDTVTFCSVVYNEDNNKWISENYIEDKAFDTYEEMKNYMISLEDEILNNGYSIIELP